MFKKTIFAFIIMFLLSLTIVSAIDFVPSGDINGRDYYDIKNIVDVNASNFCDGNGYCLNNFSSVNYSASGTLLQLDDTTFSIREGTITDGKVCSYSAANGQECTTQALGTVNSPQFNGMTLTGNVNFTDNNITDINSVFLDVTGCEEETTEGALCWNADDMTLNIVTGIGNVHQVGQEIYGIGLNKEGSTLYNMEVVSLSGAQGDRPTFIAADSTNLSKSAQVGVLTVDCANNAECPVTVFGLVRNVDTSRFTAGQKLYINASDPGNLTTVIPTLPNNPMWVATVVVSHSQVGSIFVNPQFDPSDGVVFTNAYINNDVTIGNNLNVTGNITATNILLADHWLTQQGNYGLHLTDDGSNVFLHADVGGINMFTIETDGAFWNLVANPGPANGYLLSSISETQGADTEINFYEGGTGHNRFYDSGSARFGGTASYLCNVFGGVLFPDCDTPGTGADVIVQDDVWVGGRFVGGNGTFYTTDSGSASFAGSVNVSTLNTGQGANELYAMDQDVLTSSNVKYAQANITGTTYTNDLITKGPIVDVRAFGAVADDDLDDTTAFINAAKLGTVLIPSGNWNVSHVIIPNKVHFILDNNATIYHDDSNNPLFRLQGEGSIIEGGTLIGFSDNVSDGGSGVTIQADNCIVRNVRIYNTSYGIQSSESSGTVIENNVIEGTSYISVFVASQSSNNSNIKILNNRITKLAGTLGAIFVYGETTTDSYLTDVQITGNTVTLPYNTSDSGKAGINPQENVRRVTISDNIVTNGYFGISMAQCEKCVADSNVIKNSSKYGIEIASSPYTIVSNNVVDGGNIVERAIAFSGSGSSYSVVDGNIVLDYADEGIYLRNQEYTSVTGNTIKQTTYDANYHIYLSNSDFTTIQGNLMEGSSQINAAVFFDSSQYATFIGNINNRSVGGLQIYTGIAETVDYYTIIGNFFFNSQEISTTFPGGGSLGSHVTYWDLDDNGDLYLDYSNKLSIRSGAFIPNGNIVAQVGSLWFKTNGGVNTTLFVKQANSTGNTGWSPVLTG